MAKEKKPSIQDIITKAKKDYDLHIGPLSSLVEDVPSYTTGNIAIDHIFGVSGIPVGRSIELYGPPSSGKSTVALQCAAELQHLIINGGNDDPEKGPLVGPNDKIVYEDFEHALDPTYAAALGLDFNHDSVLFMQPTSFEEGANVARSLIDTGSVRLITFDSIAAMTPSARLEAETGKPQPAILAKLMAEFLQTLNATLHHNYCSAIFLNHIMEVMGTMRSNGNSVLHSSSTR